MKKQPIILKGLHSAFDELELLVVEGEILDMDIIIGLQKRFRKLKKIIKQQKRK